MIKNGFSEYILDCQSMYEIKENKWFDFYLKDDNIKNWLEKYNPDPLDYQNAVQNFLYSSIGYSISSFLL